MTFTERHGEVKVVLDIGKTSLEAVLILPPNFDSFEDPDILIACNYKDTLDSSIIDKIN